MTKLAFLDTETIGLDCDRHGVWEVALVLREDGKEDVARVWQLPVDLGEADAAALKIGRWYERRWPWPVYESTQNTVNDDLRRINDAVTGDAHYVIPWDRMDDWAALFAELTDGAHLVGAVISFDEERLRRLLRRHRACPSWHYHLIDVEALAAGWLACETGYTESVGTPAEGFDPRPPWDSNALSAAVGVEPDKFDRHTALGDAYWARAIHDAVMGWDVEHQNELASDAAAWASENG